MLDAVRFRLFLATFAGWVGRRQTLAIAYLIEENRVLKEQLESGGGRLRFTDQHERVCRALRAFDQVRVQDGIADRVFGHYGFENERCE